MEFPFLILWEELGIKTFTRKTAQLEPLYNYTVNYKIHCVRTCVYGVCPLIFNTSDLTVKLRSTTSASPPPPPPKKSWLLETENARGVPIYFVHLERNT